jgi:hypothetical protein
MLQLPDSKALIWVLPSLQKEKKNQLIHLALKGTVKPGHYQEQPGSFLSLQADMPQFCETFRPKHRNFGQSRMEPKNFS